MYARLTLEACAGLTTLAQFDDSPDAADDTFLLAVSALQACPGIVLTDQVLPALLETTAAGVLVQHRCACRRTSPSGSNPWMVSPTVIIIIVIIIDRSSSP